MTIKGLVAGKVAIVTGSGANIGEACARRLAQEGAKVVLGDLNQIGAEAVAASICAGGGDAIALPLDLASEDNIKGFIAGAIAKYGRLDVLHNNAANTAVSQMTADGALTDMDADVWDAAFRINARGTMLMIKHAAPHMIASGGGSIINTSTGVSILGDLFNPAYSSSKAAVNALTRNTAVQFGRANIRCNAIMPGLVLSPQSREMMTPAQLNMIQRQVLLPRESMADDIAGAVLFLASELSSFMTGQVFSVDGGICHHTPYYGDVMDMMAAASPL